MHSLAMAEDILRAALTEAEKNKAQNIKAIKVVMEDEHFTEPDSLQFCLEAVTRGTIAEGAQIEVNLLKRSCECQDCSFVFTFDHHFNTCPRCDSKNLKMLTDEPPVQISLKVD